MAKTSILMSLILSLGYLLNSGLVFAQSPKNIEIFDITSEPGARDWRRFKTMSGVERQRLWNYHEKKQISLSGWSWGWRLGWVQVCGVEKSTFCEEILDKGLFDQALVVRAEAATRIGEKFQGTKDQAAIKRLKQAYGNRQNSRNGRPLFVQNRILHALHKIGGAEANATAKALATKHADSRQYWQKLSKKI